MITMFLLLMNDVSHIFGLMLWNFQDTINDVFEAKEQLVILRNNKNTP